MSIFFLNGLVVFPTSRVLYICALERIYVFVKEKYYKFRTDSIVLLQSSANHK